MINAMKKKLSLAACEAIIEASLYWTGEDEENHPELKKMRTLAGIGKVEYEKELISIQKKP